MKYHGDVHAPRIRSKSLKGESHKVERRCSGIDVHLHRNTHCPRNSAISAQPFNGFDFASGITCLDIRCQSCPLSAQPTGY